jgi:hypothetical protein
MRYIAVLNRSKKVTNADVQVMTQACYQQLERHAAVAWGRVPCPVIFHADPATVPDNAEQIVLFDSPTEAGALGYHTETPDGRIYGRVFCNPVLNAKGGTVLEGAMSVSSVLSHEVLEQFIDPDINLWYEDAYGKLYAGEVGDPVEADVYVVMVGKKAVAVSNFVFPEWFDSENRRGARFDQMGRLKKPFTMTAGGYMVVKDKGRDQEVYARSYPEWKKPGKTHVAARTARRKAKKSA